jgi:hypothetical protein
MTAIGLHAAIVAFVLSLAATPVHPAAAADFADQCLEGGGGMFVKEECDCLDDNVEDDDREVLVALFKAALKAKSGGKELDGDTPIVKNAFIVLGKYEKQCSKK